MNYKGMPNVSYHIAMQPKYNSTQLNSTQRRRLTCAQKLTYS